ncbi:TonB-dependent receptor [Olivibacter domesticus]|nr:TonB-dependent receptor [Olivibacter domesticus]
MYTKIKNNGNSFIGLGYGGLLAILLLFVAITAGGQQKVGKISGIIKTSDGQALAYASVLLADTRYGIMSNNEGVFSFEAPSGQYMLIVTYAGFTTVRIPVDIKTDISKDVGVIMVNAASNELREVIVSDIQKNKFAKKESNAIARMPLADLENPSSYSVVTKEIMQEQIAIDYNTAVASVPGVIVNNGVNDSGNDVTLRGFRGQATFRNGLAIDPRTQSEIANVERIEILKGPAGTLFGGAMSTYGGVVNTITKKPFESFRGEVSYTTGSWGLNRFTADVNTPLNKDRTALMRVNASGHTQSSQDAGFLRSTSFAASMLFKTSERTSVRFDAEVYSPTKTLNAYVRNSNVLTVSSLKDLNLTHRRSFTSDDIGTTRTSVYAMAEIEHKISNQWISKTSFQHGESGESNSIFLVLTYLNNDSISRGIRPFDQYRVITDNLQQNFIGDFKIGGLRNRMVIGLDYFAHTLNYQFANFPAAGGRTSVFAPYDAVRLDDDTPWNAISRNQVNDLQRASTVNQRDKYYTISAYASDVVNITDNILAMASLRVDRYENQRTLVSGVNQDNAYDQVQLSPKFGLVYQVLKDKVALFGNYVNGFRNIAPGFDTNGDVVNWKPEQANQIEGGVKLDLLDNKLSSTISYYNIEVKDMVRAIDNITSVQDGNQKSKGFEMELIANPVEGLNIVVGYAYNDNEYELANASSEGKRAPWTPVHVANFWASYKLLQGRVKGLGFGAGFNHAGKTYMEVSNTFSVPAYSIVGATVFFDQPKYRVGLKVNNLTNQTYWNFYGQPQKPTELVANISYKF